MNDFFRGIKFIYFIILSLGMIFCLGTNLYKGFVSEPSFEKNHVLGLAFAEKGVAIGFHKSKSTRPYSYSFNANMYIGINKATQNLVTYNAEGNIFFYVGLGDTCGNISKLNRLLIDIETDSLFNRIIRQSVYIPVIYDSTNIHSGYMLITESDFLKYKYRRDDVKLQFGLDSTAWKQYDLLCGLLDKLESKGICGLYDTLHTISLNEK